MLASNIGVTWVRDIRRKAASRGAAQLRFWGCDPMNGAKLGVMALLASSAGEAKAGYETGIVVESLEGVGESRGVTGSAEAIGVDPKTWTVAWRGGVSGAAKALEALTAGQPVTAAAAPVTGAQIAFPA